MVSKKVTSKKPVSKKSTASPKKWAQNIDIKEGTLHTALGVPKSKKVGKTLINKVAKAKIGDTISTPGGKKKVTTEMKRKAMFVKNVSKKY